MQYTTLVLVYALSIIPVVFYYLLYEKVLHRSSIYRDVLQNYSVLHMLPSLGVSSNRFCLGSIVDYKLFLELYFVKRGSTEVLSSSAE